MARRNLRMAGHLDTVERPFYIESIHTTLYSLRPHPAHVADVRPDDPDPDFHAPQRAFTP